MAVLPGPPLINFTIQSNLKNILIMAKLSIFDKAKAKGATASGKPKNEKIEVVITDPMFHTNLARLAEVNSELDALAAESASLGAIVKEEAVKNYTKLYEKEGKNPGSFILRANGNKGIKSASLMFLTTDRYISINEERANELTNKYGASIVTETTTWTMDSALVEKYGDILGDLIEKCNKISDSDKEKLIKAVTKFEVTKGTISDLQLKYPGHAKKEILEDIKPVHQMKNVKIDE